MSTKALFDAIRTIKGSALTQTDVDAVNAALNVASTVSPAPGKLDAVEPDRELIEQLKIDEGCRLTAYKDTVGVWTVGYGHAHVPPGTVWTQAEAEAQLIKDVEDHNADLAIELPWVANLDPVRRRVLQNMAFNLGVGSATSGKGLLGFKNTLEYARTGQYDNAATNMLASKWAKQVGQRAVRLARQMRTGQ